MKLGGKTISGLNIETIVLPRGDDNQLVFHAQAVLSYAKFEEMFPPPKPRLMKKPGGVQFQNFEDPTYLKDLASWSEKRYQWLILKSLEASEGLEWDTVKMDDPETWGNYEQDLRSAGLTDIEVGRLVTGVMTANALNEEKIEAAKKRFLALKEVAVPSQLSQVGEQPSTSSGEPAKG